MDENNTSTESKSPFSLILARARKGLIAVAVFSLVLNLLMLTAPLYMLQIFDRVLSSQSLDTLLWLTLVAISSFVVLSLLDVIRNRILGAIGTWIDGSLGAILVKQSIQNAAFEGSSTPPSSSLRDLAQIRNFLSGNGTLALIDVPWTPFFVAVVFMLHPWLGMMALGGILVLIMLAVLGELGARRRLRSSGARLSHLYSMIDSASQSANALVSMGALERMALHWKSHNTELLEQTQHVNGQLASAVATGKFVRLSLQVLIMGLGAMLVIRQELTPGGMIAASIILTRALAPIEQLIGAWRAFISSREAIQRIAEQLSKPGGGQRPVSLPRPTGVLEVQGLSYAIPNENRFLFRDLEFRLGPGEILGVFGPSGSGKTTLAKMLVGLTPPTTGEARIDGSDISHWSLDEMGRYFGYLPQGFELFAGSVRENISRFSDAPIEEVIEAAKLADAHDFIIRLPDGYETKIHRRSPLLSGGQQQRIALARALFGVPSLLVLDEPNANLDPVGELSLLKTLDRLRKRSVTVVLIAHRSNILRSADQLLMMHEGKGELITQKPPGAAENVLGRRYSYVDNLLNDRRERVKHIERKRSDAC